MNANGERYRYEFAPVFKKGNAPCLQVTDRYLAPLVVNKYFFKYDNHGKKELNGYGADMINKILAMLDPEYLANPERVNHIVVTESMSRIKKALEQLGAAMEEYDDRTGSKSEFIFKSTSKNGEVFTSDVKNSLI